MLGAPFAEALGERESSFGWLSPAPPKNFDAFPCGWDSGEVGVPGSFTNGWVSPSRSLGLAERQLLGPPSFPTRAASGPAGPSRCSTRRGWWGRRSPSDGPLPARRRLHRRGAASGLPPPAEDHDGRTHASTRLSLLSSEESSNRQRRRGAWIDPHIALVGPRRWTYRDDHPRDARERRCKRRPRASPRALRRDPRGLPRPLGHCSGRAPSAHALRATHRIRVAWTYRKSARADRANGDEKPPVGVALSGHTSRLLPNG